MSLQKDCADRLRATYAGLTGKKLGAGHAHELVAAFFGYGTAAALQAEAHFPLAAIDEADYLMPDLKRMDLRIKQIQGIPSDLPSVDDLASDLCDFLVSAGRFTGVIWQARDLSELVNDYVHGDPLMIEDALAGEMATTNAYFDELLIEEFKFEAGEDALVATLDGVLNGENDQDRAFHGNKIVFTTAMTFDRIGGRIAFRKPKLKTQGEVDDSDYYD